MASLTEVAHELQHFGVVALQLELFHLSELRNVHRCEDGLRCGIVDDAAAALPKEEVFGQSERFGAPIDHRIFEFSEGGRHCVAEIGSLEGGGVHFSEDRSDVDGGRVIPEVFRRLPIHDSGRDGVLRPFEQMLDCAAFLGSTFGQNVAQETRFGVGVNGLFSVTVTLLNKLHHLLRTLLKSPKIVESMRHI